jgi:hypothetical protein
VYPPWPTVYKVRLISHGPAAGLKARYTALREAQVRLLFAQHG